MTETLALHCRTATQKSTGEDDEKTLKSILDRTGLSLHEKRAHRQGLHCSGVGLSFAVLRPAGQDHKACRAGTGKRRVNQAL